MTKRFGFHSSASLLAGLAAVLLSGPAASVSAQDALAGTARTILEKNKMALVVVTVDGKLVAETDGGPLPERTQQRRTLGVTIRPENGLVVISNAAIDPSIGLSGQRARVDDKVVTIQTAKTVFEKVEISYGDSAVIPGKIIKQDVGGDVAFVLPDQGTAKALGKAAFNAIDLSGARTPQPADQVVGLSRSSAAYGYMPTVIVGRVTGVFKGEYRTFFVTTAGTAQGIPIFTMDGRPVGITLERVIDNKRSGILGTLQAGSIKVMAELALGDYNKTGSTQLQLLRQPLLPMAAAIDRIVPWLVVSRRRIGFLFGLLLFAAAVSDAQSSEFELKKGERIVLLGGTLAERFQYSGWLEARLQAAHPGAEISLRNMGWSGDEVALMPRPLNFGELEDHLTAQRADVILMFFGANESFGGSKKLKQFERDLVALIARLQSKPFNGKTPARLVLISPIAHEQLGPPWPEAGPRNALLEAYTDAIEKVAEQSQLPSVDLFRPTRSLMAENGSGKPLTINGIHLTDDGSRIVSEVLAIGLGVTDPLPGKTEKLRELIIEKNRQFFLRWRPVNAEYIFGRRNKPFGVLTYPPEMEQLDRQIAELDRKIQNEAAKSGRKKGGAQ